MLDACGCCLLLDNFFRCKPMLLQGIRGIQLLLLFTVFRRQHTLKTTEAFDQIEDLKMLAAKEENKRIIEMSCRQQLEHQALSLQDRYEQLLHYLQELEEKRSAYEDAMRVALSNCQKAEAMLQIREEEAAYAKHYMEKQDAQMLVSLNCIRGTVLRTPFARWCVARSLNLDDFNPLNPKSYFCRKKRC